MRIFIQVAIDYSVLMGRANSTKTLMTERKGNIKWENSQVKE
jgi:hypothetical protein